MGGIPKGAHGVRPHRLWQDLPAGYDSVDQVRAEAVSQVRVGGGVKEDQVSALAWLEAADLITQAESMGCIDGGGADRLGRRHRHGAAG
jgi:hypothetical protein